MSTSPKKTAVRDKPARPETVEQSEDDSQEADEEQVAQEVTKKQAKGVGQPAAGSNSQAYQYSITYGQQAEEARRAYAQYMAQFGVTSAQLAAQQGMAAAWGYPGPGGAYYPAYMPVGPGGTPMMPQYYAAPIPPGSRPMPGGPPMSMGHQYMAPSHIGLAAPPQGADTGAGTPSRPRKTVTDKVFIACSYCRRRKLRCNGEQPKCSVCVRYSEECNYDQKRRTRGPGRKSLQALGLGEDSEKNPRKRARKSDATSQGASASPVNAQQPDAHSAPQALAAVVPPTSLTLPRLSDSPPPVPMPAPSSYPPVAALEGNALTAAAIMNALPVLQGFPQPNGQPYPLMYGPMHSPPMPPPGMPQPPMPATGANAALDNAEPKTPSPKARKKKAAKPSPSGQKRKRGRKAAAEPGAEPGAEPEAEPEAEAES
ncbi:hypothetical protein CALCODRAFT_503308 [Calocera cornea HHB12733]|uniref:Zn(2)-C6 fungal-type domain-containing protein n=1 Tax=Calocera cornea HHB12733 TaxID=1353952 RepID=A0A165CX99_9BASI|nr:hypothetical protein CALCODRAFT_503308 [Calocera cornea HHB12733]